MAFRLRRGTHFRENHSRRRVLIPAATVVVAASTLSGLFGSRKRLLNDNLFFRLEIGVVKRSSTLQTLPERSRSA